MSPRRSWAVVWVAAVLATAAVVGGRHAVARLYVSRTAAERATFDPTTTPWYGLYAIDGLPPEASVFRVRLTMLPYGPLVGDSGGDRYTCELSPVHRPFGWRATFEFHRGRLLSTRFVQLDNPVLPRWARVAVWAEYARQVVGWATLTAGLVAVLTAIVLRRYRRPVAAVGAAVMLVGVAAAALGDQPDRTFRPIDQWRSAVVPAALLAITATMAAWPARRRPVRGVCFGCGYDLRGNASGVCPECGTPVPAGPPRASAAAVDALAAVEVDDLAADD